MISFSAGASTPTDVNTLTKDFENTKQKLEEAEVKQRQVLSALYQVNKKVKKIVTEKGNLSQQRAYLEVNNRILGQKITELEERTKSQRAMLAERLKAIYKLGGPSLARFLFSSNSSASLERNLKILGFVAGRDVEVIRNYSRDLKDLDTKKKALAVRLEKIKNLETQIAQQEKLLRSEQVMKNKLLDGIRKSRLFALNKIQGLREKSLHFNIDDAGVFDLLFKASFSDQKGNLPLPLQGVVTRKFGLMKGQDQPYTFNNKGIYISAAKGSEIKSIFGGRVSFVGSVPGFGQTLIVDHGDHYYSVYSHADAVKVQEGDEVTQAQVLAQVGDVAFESNPGLYFEIRHFSEPYDPQLWMKGL
ncbi:murein hydrolase activator EnvC family protein [Bdellovibrio sp. HCB2-146]|uniref:murein hydrolase activator EnvC family protein n=1 Tax=Bdellovibrio sp. HCB2-146 TaxID=3394362 RepID=UPI0039BC88E1